MFTVVCVCFQDAKKSRLPILIKPSRLLESVYHFSDTQEVVAQLQSQILELQGELKECKTHNKKLHQKLILADAMMEGRPVPNQMLLNGKNQKNAFSTS
jgi:CDK5 regulatory subunit-associated protein 2